MAFQNKKELFEALIAGEIIVHKDSKILIKFAENGALVYYIEDIQQWDKCNPSFEYPQLWMLARDLK